MQTLFPQIKPYARHDLAVDGPHVLYVDESGTPDGLPVVFVHGGPGAGCDANSRCYFDPGVYRIITFDRRRTWKKSGGPTTRPCNGSFSA